MSEQPVSKQPKGKQPIGKDIEANTASEKPDRSTWVMVGAAFSGLVALLIVVVLVATLFIRGGVVDTGGEGNGPFNIGARPIPDPAQTNPGVLYPAALGDFQRVNVTGTINTFNVSYKRGNDEVTIRVGKQLSFAAAQQMILLERDDLPAANRSERLLTAQPNLTYYYDVRDVARLYYNHDQWFFMITANSEGAMNAFMAVAPY